MIARRHGLFVLEDAAEAHGQTYRGRPCGSLGDISTFSFYPNKLVTTGEGGMIVTNDDALAATCYSLRNLCFQAQRRFVHERLGWNLRMTNLQAALGVAQLERIDEFAARKRAMGKRYTELLSGIPGLQLPAGKNRLCRKYLLGLRPGVERRGRFRRGRRHEEAGRAGNRLPALLLPHEPTAGPARARPVQRRVLSGCGADVSQRFLYPQRPGTDGRSDDARGRSGRLNSAMTEVFDAYAAYYDLLYRDKDYPGEARYVQSLLRRHGCQRRRDSSSWVAERASMLNSWRDSDFPSRAST